MVEGEVDRFLSLAVAALDSAELIGVDILQKKPKNAPEGKNSAPAKFPEFSKIKSGSNP